MLAKLRDFAPITQWGAWCRQVAGLSDAELAAHDIAARNLACAEDLPGADNALLAPCLDKVDDWAELVDRFTRHFFSRFTQTPEAFRNSEARFRVVALADCLSRHVGIQYNYAFTEGEYDASDSRNLFIHGILTGFGGTCASMPVLYCAIGRRLGYPLNLAEAREHCFCRWGDNHCGEHFCFDATGQGCIFHEEDYYRHWPKPLTPTQERRNGAIRAMTPHEELAAFAATRGNCLFDNFSFASAVEAFFLAHQIAPHKQCLHDSWGLAVYSSRLWANLQNLPDNLRHAPLEQTIGLAASKLHGPDADFFREHAVENVLRIVRNRRRREREQSHDAAFQELATHSGIKDPNHV